MMFTTYRGESHIKGAYPTSMTVNNRMIDLQRKWWLLTMDCRVNFLGILLSGLSNENEQMHKYFWRLLEDSNKYNLNTVLFVFICLECHQKNSVIQKRMVIVIIRSSISSRSSIYVFNWNQGLIMGVNCMMFVIVWSNPHQ